MINLAEILQSTPAPQNEELHNLVSPGALALHLIQAAEHYKTLVVVLPDRKEIEKLLSYLHAFGLEDTVYYPTPSLSPYDWTGEERLSSQQRHRVRHRLLNTEKPPRCILMTYRAPTHIMMDNVTWYQSSLNLYPGDELAPPLIVQQLIQAGYEPVNWISEPGQFTRRGAVLDIYPVGLDRVARIEWFDDEVEKLYSYKLNAPQEKPREEKNISIPPAYEWIIPTDFKSLKVKLQENHRGNFVQLLKNFQYQAELFQIMPFFHPITNLFGSLPAQSLIVWSEGMWHKCKTYTHLLDKTAQERKIEPAHITLEQLKSSVEPYAQQQLKGHDGESSGSILPPVESQLDRQAHQFKQWLKAGKQICIVTPQPQRILSILDERDCPTSQKPPTPNSKYIHVLKGNLPAGFAHPGLNLFCFSDHELFPRQKHMTRKRKAPKRTAALKLSQLKENMLVVHDVHGIGSYQGLVQYSTTGETREYLAVSYAGSDRLLVPVEQMHRLQLYHAVGGQKIKLHKLGGNEWEKAKSKVKKSLIEIAEQLLKTEASRMQAQGIAFPEDGEWQKEVEAAFPFEETPDQLKAIQDTKLDMELSQPMNRLICGDVGFGKTEVALRAAFKAAISGYQVAFLAPTTILAHQHYQVLKERFASYPVRVELLSRYRSQKESDAVFKELQTGAIDVVVATHRLLSKKLKFHKLGLLVIDEEHRFGVGQKEKLKQLAPNIDILTMSATPIPRTLNIAMGGLKAMSLIETPPPNRHPIKTQVEAHDDEHIKKALYHELQRGGQIYYIHNRVKSIYEVGRRIQDMVPQARVRVAHGQMSKQELERTMWDFYQHDFDVLVCTTIVESGLDIPNCNTLIIEKVELLGLAQIHQLRGRVGRSNIQAYAHLLYDRHKPLTQQARERLTVVQEYSGLGSGFYLSMKDMEIRGIGNLLGPQQHGNIMTVGFDTYCQLLEDTIANLRGLPMEQREYTACVIDLNVSAYIPDQWLQDPAEKMRIYRTFANANDLDYIDEFWEQIQKKHPKVPPQAETLYEATRARVLGNSFHIEKIAYNAQRIELEGPISPELLALAQRKAPELKPWKLKGQSTLGRPKLPSGKKNLDLVLKLLEALERARSLQDQELNLATT